jgi:hypothetical protein
VFPLRAALSYELAQAYVTGSHCLLVGWPSDLLYLHLLNQACQDAGLATLDPRWAITPVGGADKVSTFISLVGSAKLNVAALIDGGPHDQQRIKVLADNGHLRVKSLVQLSDFTTGKEAEIEDLLDSAIYCAIVSGAYSTELPVEALKPADLKSRLPRITARTEQYFKENAIAGGKLDRYKLASYLIREQQTLVPKLAPATLERSAKVFERINACLK